MVNGGKRKQQNYHNCAEMLYSAELESNIANINAKVKRNPTILIFASS